MIERITPDNPLQPRHAGMMAVLRNKSMRGPLEKMWHGHWQISGDDDGGRWTDRGHANHICLVPCDIIAVLPMPDLSGLESE